MDDETDGCDLEKVLEEELMQNRGDRKKRGQSNGFQRIHVLQGYRYNWFCGKGRLR